MDHIFSRYKRFAVQCKCWSGLSTSIFPALVLFPVMRNHVLEFESDSMHYLLVFIYYRPSQQHWV